MILLKKNIKIEDITCKNSISTFKLEASSMQRVAHKWNDLLQDAANKDKQLWDSASCRLESIEEKPENRAEIKISSIPFSVRYPMRFLDGIIEPEDTSTWPRGMFLHVLFQTKDGYFVFGSKSQALYSHRNVTFVGGVLDFKAQAKDIIQHTLFLELEEEIFVTSEDLQDIVFMGAYQNDHFNVGLLVLCSSKLMKQQLEDRFKDNNSKTNELASLIFIEANNLNNFITKEFSYGNDLVNLL